MSRKAMTLKAAKMPSSFDWPGAGETLPFLQLGREQRHEQREQAEEEQVDEDGEAHALLAVEQREHLAGVREGDGALAPRVEEDEDEDEQGDDDGAGRVAVGDVEGEAGGQQRERHARVRCQQQEAPAALVDEVVGWEGEQEVGQADAPAQPDTLHGRVMVSIVHVLEKGRAVDGEDVYTAEFVALWRIISKIGGDVKVRVGLPIMTTKAAMVALRVRLSRNSCHSLVK